MTDPVNFRERIFGTVMWYGCAVLMCKYVFVYKKIQAFLGILLIKTVHLSIK